MSAVSQNQSENVSTFSKSMNFSWEIVSKLFLKCQQIFRNVSTFSKSANFSKRCQQFSENQCISREKNVSSFSEMSANFLKMSASFSVLIFQTFSTTLSACPFRGDTS